MDAEGAENRKRVLLSLGAAVAVAAAIVAVVVLTTDDEDPVATDDTTSTTETPTSSTTTEPSTSSTGFQGVDPDVPVYPDPTASRRFDDPAALVLAFATDFVGFTDPVIGDYEADDDRSGEVAVRAFAEGAPTVVAVEQLDDDAWYVVGVSTDSIRLETPQIGDTLTSPQPLEGQAYAYEGNVVVRLYADGVQEPIGETSVTGRGDGVLGPFTGSLTFTNDTGATHGVLVLFGESGEDGAPVEVSAIRVRLP